MAGVIRCTNGHDVGLLIDAFNYAKAQIIKEKIETQKIDMRQYELSDTSDPRIKALFKHLGVDKCDQCRIILVTERTGVI